MGLLVAAVSLGLALHVPGLGRAAPSRRDFLVGAAGAAAASVVPLSARAEMYGEGKAPKVGSQAESVMKAKEVKFAKAGDETEAFKKAEAKRREAQRLYDSGQKPRQETTEETMARLGLKAYQ